MSVHIHCDKCKVSCKNETSGEWEYATLSYSWGYGSANDGTQGEIHLCDKCFSGLTSGWWDPGDWWHPEGERT